MPRHVNEVNDELSEILESQLKECYAKQYAETYYVARFHYLPESLPVPQGLLLWNTQPGIQGNGPDPKIVTEHYIRELLNAKAFPPALQLVVHEVASSTEEKWGRPHYHCVFGSYHSSKDIRNMITKWWHGQGMYQLKLAKPDLILEHFNYLCKGTGTGHEDGPNVIERSGHFTDEIIEECHRLFWYNNDKIQATRKKRKASSISEQCFDLCKHLTPPIDRREIYDIIHGYYKKRILHWNPDYVRKLVYQTQMYLEPSDSQANLDMKNYCVGLPFRPE